MLITWKIKGLNRLRGPIAELMHNKERDTYV